MYVHVYERETAGTTPCDNLVLNQMAKPERERGKERDRERDRQTGTDRQTDRQTHTHTHVRTHVRTHVTDSYAPLKRMSQ